MKTHLIIFLMGSFLLFGTGICPAQGKNDQPAGGGKGSKITIVGTPELENLVSTWLDGYGAKQAGRDIIISDNVGEVHDGRIYFFTSNNPGGVSGRLAGKIVVGHEIIVPIINSSHPLLKAFERDGMAADGFAALLSGREIPGGLEENSGKLPLRVYALDCDKLVSRLAGYCALEPQQVSALKVKAADELISLVGNDVNAIGFCRLSDVMGPAENGFVEGIRIIPVDKNQNGTLDAFENIYSSPEALNRGAWIGKYPRKLCSEVFAGSTTLPMDDASNAFLEWVVEQGQDTMASLGFSHLTTREKTAGLLALRPALPSDVTPSAPGSPNRWITVAAGLAVIFLLYVLIKAGSKRKTGVQSEDIVVTSALNVQSIKAPAGLFYDRTHTWAFMEQNGLVKVGVNDFLPHVTGPVSHIKMKAPGEKVRKGEKILTLVREGKQLDIYSPVTGQIKAQNNSLAGNPSQVNTDPYSSGWIYQVEPLNWLREMKFMFMADKFKDWLEDEFVRLKDFLAASANSNAVVYNHVVLQDGGELTDNVLADLEPKIWEDFQTRFIDTSK